MTDKIFHFVRHHEVPAYERIGWTRHPSLDGTHHGEWSALMEWTGSGEPVKPFFLPRETNSDGIHRVLGTTKTGREDERETANNQ